MLSVPEKWQGSPSAPWLGSHDRPQKVGLRARYEQSPASESGSSSSLSPPPDALVEFVIRCWLGLVVLPDIGHLPGR